MRSDKKSVPCTGVGHRRDDGAETQYWTSPDRHSDSCCCCQCWLSLRSSSSSTVPARFSFVRNGSDWRGRSFRIFKFRSMVVDAARAGTALTVRGRQEDHAGGNFLRSTKLDELPQLINVLAGDMSIVGPATRSAGIHEILHAGSTRDHPLDATGNHRLRSHPVS